MAQVWRPPAEIWAKVCPPVTAVAVPLEAPTDPIPSWPTSFFPQQAAAPSKMAQLCMLPAEMYGETVEVNPPTVTGKLEIPPTEPLPSCPSALSPQQLTWKTPV